MAWLYAAVGALLGVGAPAGALLLRVLVGARAAEDLRRFSFFYLYELLGTAAVFGVAGFLAGRRADLLRRGRDRFRDMAERDRRQHLSDTRGQRRARAGISGHA